MKLPVKLQDLINENEAVLAPIAQLLTQGSAVLDCSGVETVPSDRLDHLFAALPGNWDYPDFQANVDPTTLHPKAQQILQDWFDQRHGRTTPNPDTPNLDVPTEAAILDVFSLRDEVIQDYRTYY